jgi:hypothetical protein
LDDSAPAPDLPPSSPLAHGGRVLPAVTVDAYNEELRDDEGFVGDRASRRAFRAILADWRDRLKEHGDDPFGDVPMEEISKSKLDKMMAGDDPVAAGLVHTIIEEFAGELATVVRRFLRLESWKGTERIVLGGGLIASRIGELAMGRASVILSAAGAGVELRSIENHPDEAGLIGAVQLAPTWIMAGHDAILAVDIGGTNARVGIVELNAGKAAMYRRPTSGSANTGDTSTTSPTRSGDRAHCRDAGQAHRPRHRGKLKLAPFIGIGCPGLIDEHGAISEGRSISRETGGNRLQPSGRPGCEVAAHQRPRGRHPGAQ